MTPDLAAAARALKAMKVRLSEMQCCDPQIDGEISTAIDLLDAALTNPDPRADVVMIGTATEFISPGQQVAAFIRPDGSMIVRRATAYDVASAMDAARPAAPQVDPDEAARRKAEGFAQMLQIGEDLQQSLMGIIGGPNVVVCGQELLLAISGQLQMLLAWAKIAQDHGISIDDMAAWDQAQRREYRDRRQAEMAQAEAEHMKAHGHKPS